MAAIPGEPREELERLERKHAGNAEGRFFVPLADAYRRAGDPAGAIGLLREGLQSHPEYLSAHIVLGRCYLDLNDPAAAEVEFRYVLALDPQNLIALGTLGGLAVAEGRTIEAARWYSDLLAVDPMNDDAQAALDRLAEAGHEETAPESAGGADGQEDGTGLAPPLDAATADDGSRVIEALDKYSKDMVDLTEDDGLTAFGDEAVVTETIAALYTRQGFHDRAADVYRELIRRRGGDANLEARLREAERLAAGGAPLAEPEAEAAPPAIDADAPDADSPVSESVDASGEAPTDASAGIAPSGDGIDSVDDNPFHPLIGPLGEGEVAEDEAQEVEASHDEPSVPPAYDFSAPVVDREIAEVPEAADLVDVALAGEAIEEVSDPAASFDDVFSDRASFDEPPVEKPFDDATVDAFDGEGSADDPRGDTTEPFDESLIAAENEASEGWVQSDGAAESGEASAPDLPSVEALPADPFADSFADGFAGWGAQSTASDPVDAAVEDAVDMHDTEGQRTAPEASVEASDPSGLTVGQEPSVATIGGFLRSVALWTRETESPEASPPASHHDDTDEVTSGVPASPEAAVSIDFEPGTEAFQDASSSADLPSDGVVDELGWIGSEFLVAAPSAPPADEPSAKQAHDGLSDDAAPTDLEVDPSTAAEEAGSDLEPMTPAEPSAADDLQLSDPFDDLFPWEIPDAEEGAAAATESSDSDDGYAFGEAAQADDSRAGSDFDIPDSNIPDSSAESTDTAHFELPPEESGEADRAETPPPALEDGSGIDGEASDAQSSTSTTADDDDDLESFQAWLRSLKR